MGCVASSPLSFILYKIFYISVLPNSRQLTSHNRLRNRSNWKILVLFFFFNLLSMCSLWRNLSNVHASSIIWRIYIRSYINTYIFLIQFVRSIDQRRLSFIPLRNWCGRALKRYFRSVILSLFYVTRVPLWLIYCWMFLYWHAFSRKPSRTKLCFFISRDSVLITFWTQNFISSLLTFHRTRSTFSFIYATQCFFLDITCIRAENEMQHKMHVLEIDNLYTCLHIALHVTRNSHSKTICCFILWLTRELLWIVSLINLYLLIDSVM